MMQEVQPRPSATFSSSHLFFSTSSISSLSSSTNALEVTSHWSRTNHTENWYWLRKWKVGTSTRKKNISFVSRVWECKIIITQREHRLDQKQFKEWYLHYFGLHSVAVAGCIMYSPYPATAVFAILHSVFFIIACFIHSCEV